MTQTGTSGEVRGGEGEPSETKGYSIHRFSLFSGSVCAFQQSVVSESGSSTL